jgi:GxxExxY protein
MGQEVKDPLTEKIIGACIEVHKHLGPGLFESVYQHFVSWELSQAGLSIEKERRVPALYKGMVHELGYRADLVVEDTVIVELKVHPLTRLHHAQLQTYLRLLNKPVGLLVNFNEQFLADGIKRVPNHDYKPVQGS